MPFPSYPHRHFISTLLTSLSSIFLSSCHQQRYVCVFIILIIVISILFRKPKEDILCFCLQGAGVGLVCSLATSLWVGIGAILTRQRTVSSLPPLNTLACHVADNVTNVTWSGLRELTTVYSVATDNVTSATPLSLRFRTSVVLSNRITWKCFLLCLLFYLKRCHRGCHVLRTFYVTTVDFDLNVSFSLSVLVFRAKCFRLFHNYSVCLCVCCSHGLDKWYQLSYWHYSTLSVIVSLIVAVVLSAMTGWQIS